MGNSLIISVAFILSDMLNQWIFVDFCCDII